jgi:hypothetical protein
MNDMFFGEFRIFRFHRLIKIMGWCGGGISANGGMNREENFNAHKVYEKLGFEKVGKHGFTMGSCVQMDFVMAKRL